jgi:hypothetical protein
VIAETVVSTTVIAAVPLALPVVPFRVTVTIADPVPILVTDPSAATVTTDWLELDQSRASLPIATVSPEDFLACASNERVCPTCMVVDNGLTVIDSTSPISTLLAALDSPPTTEDEEEVVTVDTEPQSMPLQATSKTSDNNTRLGRKVDLIRVIANIQSTPSR